MESNSKVPETIPCPTCGKDAVLTHWSVSEGLDPNLKRYECPRKRCRTIIFVQVPMYHPGPVQKTEPVTQGPDIFHSGEVIA